MAAYGTDKLALSFEELHMMCRVASGEIGWSNKHPDYQYGRDHLFTTGGGFVRSADGELLESMSQRDLVATVGPWVLATDKGRAELETAANFARALNPYFRAITATPNSTNQED